jgi:hypothetical protein
MDVALAGLAAAFTLITAAAPADTGAASTPQKSIIGAGVGATPLQLHTDVRPGRHYRFPPLYVVNTGSRTSNYLVRIEQLGAQTGHQVPAAWLQVARTRLRLRPHKSALIPVSLSVPKNAAGGNYRTDLIVGTSMQRPGRGATLGAAAADQLIFTIATPGFSWTSPWLLYPLLALLTLGAVVLTIRRLGLRVEIHRGHSL